MINIKPKGWLDEAEDPDEVPGDLHIDPDYWARRNYDQPQMRTFPMPPTGDAEAEYGPGMVGPPEGWEEAQNGVKDALMQQASARSKAQFRMLQGERNGAGRTKMPPEQVEDMLAPPEDPLSGQPFRKYYQFLPERAQDGPDPFEEWNKKIQEIYRLKRGGA